MSHISRLPYNNPARIVAMGKPVMDNVGRKKTYKTWRKTIINDMFEFYNGAEFLNISNRNSRKYLMEVMKNVNK